MGVVALAGYQFAQSRSCSIRPHRGPGSGASPVIGSLRSLLMMVFLPDYAGLTPECDCASRLPAAQVTPASSGMGDRTGRRTAARGIRNGSLFSPAVWIPGMAVLLFSPARVCRTRARLLAALPFLTLWILFPLAVLLINRPATTIRGGILSLADRQDAARHGTTNLALLRRFCRTGNALAATGQCSRSTRRAKSSCALRR